jgi:hypothetical protein
VWWLAVIAFAAMVGWFGFRPDRPLRSYPDFAIDQIESSKAREIKDAYDDAERQHIRLDKESEIVPAAQLVPAAALRRVVVEAEAMRGEAQRERKLRKYLFLAIAAEIFGLMIAILFSVRAGRRSKQASAATAAQSGSTRYQPAAPDEAWARQILSIGSFATIADVETAFTNLMAQYHPDKVGHLGKDLQNLADQKTRDLIKARDLMRRLLSGGGVSTQK